MEILADALTGYTLTIDLTVSVLASRAGDVRTMFHGRRQFPAH